MWMCERCSMNAVSNNILSGCRRNINICIYSLSRRAPKVVSLNVPISCKGTDVNEEKKKAVVLIPSYNTYDCYCMIHEWHTCTLSIPLLSHVHGYDCVCTYLMEDIVHTSERHAVSSTKHHTMSFDNLVYTWTLYKSISRTRVSSLHTHPLRCNHN